MTSLIDRTENRLGAINGMGQPYAQLEVFNEVTAAAVGTSAWMPKMLGDLRFVTASTGGETIQVQGSKNGSTWIVLTPIIETTGNPAASSNLASGTYKLPLRTFGHFRQFRWVKSAAVQRSTVAYAVARPYQTP